ncbi:enoyl-CoA hydratase/isomerase family protein [Fodinibius salsisoli]|uniref:Enoyl-CoA hydratase/isomerase family protein n=1 Tax=Fodinibius salsisoli TaxID=2820877 RepID=A0ABT3PMP4_9BACT|nr:enoyl-CoA hydratase/isomerase family protein [Fodinibius salsisoli]
MSILKVEFKNNICLATVNRPPVHNAINFDIMAELETLLEKLETNEETRALILTGCGRQTFISGGDLREFHSLKTEQEAERMAKRMLSILARIEKLPCWTIASINGAAYGGGWEMMLAFDFRIATSDATFGFTQSKFYLPPGWGGLTRLVERVGRSTALRWLGEAATVDTEEALSEGLIDRVSNPGQLEADTQNWAQDLTRTDRAFIKNLKEGALQFTKSRWKAIEAELDSFAQFWESDEHQQRVESFLGEN